MNDSRSVSTLAIPKPNTSDLLSVGCFVAMTLAIWDAYSSPIVSRGPDPAPSSVRGVKRTDGSMASSDDGSFNKDVSELVGFSLSSGTVT